MVSAGFSWEVALALTFGMRPGAIYDPAACIEVLGWDGVVEFLDSAIAC